MAARADDPARTRRVLARAWRDVVGDAAAISGARLVELLVPSDRPAPAWESAAFAAPGLSRTARAEVARELARSPAAAELPEPRRGAGHRAAGCEAPLARALGARGLQQVFLPVNAASGVLGWLRFVREGRFDRAALHTCRALARQTSGRLEAERLRRELAARHQRAAADVDREQRALIQLSQAKDTLAALNLAGTHLMVETDEQVICGVICRELLRLGYPAAVLVADRGLQGPRPPYRYAATSFRPAVQAATERVLTRPLAEVRVDPRAAPLVGRVLRQGRTAYTARAREAARQLFGGTPEQVRKLARLLRLRHVIVAPLRFGEGVSGLLVVATAALRPGDPAAIDAFALQASIALEKGRLFGELKRHQLQLESEVERRTRELTRAVRALKELDRRKDNFLANVSHELRTPLVTVLGYTDLILSGKLGALTDQQRECLGVASTSARRLRSFIDELLDFSRHELTRDHLTLGPVDLPELLQQAALSVAPRYQERRLLLRVRVERNTPPVWGDRDKLLQVLMNLLLNAERYCRPGGHVHLAAARGPAGHVELAVRDDGEGIPPEHLERIFDRLYQVGDAVQARERGAGLGLGLAIVKSIVLAHGGRIGVRSQVGRGTRFRIELPTVDGVQLQEEQPAAPEQAGS